MVKIWSCKGCSHYKQEVGCTKENGCDYIPAMVRLEEILTDDRPTYDEAQECFAIKLRTS